MVKKTTNTDQQRSDAFYKNLKEHPPVKATWFDRLLGIHDDPTEPDLSPTSPIDSWLPGEWFYAWSQNGRLQLVIDPKGVRTHFTYDALGRRLSKTHKDRTFHYVWDGNTLLHEWVAPHDQPRLFVDENGKLQAEPPKELVTWVFEEGSFVPQAKLVNGKSYSIITDHLGTPFVAYDENGKSVWKQELDIYGKVRSFTGDQTFISFRYQGQYEDIETGLYYNRFRYYSPDSGTYVSQDPIGLAGNNPNFYAYVKDSNAWIDPFGLETILTSGSVYRMGSGTDGNLTPRPGKDTTSGLSTSLDKPTSGKFQTIDVSKLDDVGLEAVNDHGKHVSIRPKNDPDFKKLNEWADTRGTDVQHKYTKGLQDAKVCH